MMTASVIRAYHQREERYQGLQLDFDGSAALKETILDTVDAVSKMQGIAPMVNQFNDVSIYLEFHDEYDRDGGAFFSELLCRLGIDKCEKH